MADGESDQMVDPLWHQRCSGPSQRCPPIVAHEVRTLDIEMVHYPKNVANEDGDTVGLNAFRLVGCAVATEVGDDDPEPSFGQCRHLLAPQTPRVGEAVEQDYGLAFSSDLDFDTYTVDIDAHLVPSRSTKYKSY